MVSDDGGTVSVNRKGKTDE